jgi:hypothetical protein
MNRVELLDFANDEKKQFIKHTGSNEPIIVVNRGNGNSAYKLNYAYVDGIRSYLVENHLICVKYGAQKTKPELLQLYNNIIQSLNYEKTNEFINLYFGNNAINTTELNYILPIYISSVP